MNPFSGTLTRIGFLAWSIFLAVWVIGFGLLIDATKAQHVGVYWLPFRIVWGVVLVVVSILVIVRRLQNAGMTAWLAIVQLVPFVGTLFWLVLFFIPPKKPAVPIQPAGQYAQPPPQRPQ